MEGSFSPRSNKLVATLPPEVYEALHPHLVRVALPRHKVLVDEGARNDCVYFPVTGLLAHVLSNPDDQAIDVAICGREGIVGMSMLLGGTSVTTVVALADTLAYRCPSAMLHREAHPALRRILCRYGEILIREISQRVLCCRYHQLDEQLATWLLMCMDRLGRSELPFTHATIGRMLGVRREGITEAVGRLHDLGAISTSRALLQVVNRSLLLSIACNCYRVLGQPVDMAHERHSGQPAYPSDH